MNRKNIKFILLLLGAVFFSSLSCAETVWIDVRSVIEHSIDNIEGDVRISHDEIVQGVNKMFPDKTTTIHLYCRSGGRAGKARLVLKEAGYMDVLNAGSISDARKVRGLSE